MVPLFVRALLLPPFLHLQLIDKSKSRPRQRHRTSQSLSRHRDRNSSTDQCRRPPEIPTQLPHWPEDRATGGDKVVPLGEESGFPECRRQAGPCGGVAAGRVDVPVAAAGGEDSLSQNRVEIPDEGLLGFGVYFDGGGVAVDDGLHQDVGDVGDLDFNGVDDRVEGRECVRSEAGRVCQFRNLRRLETRYLQYGEVGMVMDECAHVSLRTTVLLPLIMERPAVLSHDVHGRQEGRHAEASSQDNGVKVLGLSFLADEARLRELLDALGKQVDIIPVQRRQVSRVVDAPLAAQRELGDDEVVILLRCLAEDVLPRLFLQCEPLAHLLLVRPVDRSELVRLEEEVEAMPSLPERNVPETELVPAGELSVRSRMVPLRAACVLGNLLDIWGDGRNDLCGAAAVTYNCNPLAGVVKMVVPLGRVENLAFVLVHAGELNVSGLGEAADGRQQDGALLCELFPRGDVTEEDVPAAVLPLCAQALDAEAEVSPKIELIHRGLNV